MAPHHSPAKPVDEAALLERLRAGDDTAFEQLVTTLSPRLLAVARRFLGNEADARDAVQDAFLAAFRNLSTFEGTAQVSTWLHRIVVNAALMKLRTRQRKPEESIETLLPSFLEDGHQAEPMRRWPSPDRVLYQREIRDVVRQAISRLPEAYRTVLLLRDIEELSTEEKAKVLNVTPNAVKIRLHRARQALATLIDRRVWDALPERKPRTKRAAAADRFAMI